MGFLIPVLVVVVGVHSYLWWRLIRSTTVSGSRARRWLTWVLVTFAVLLPVTIASRRLFGPGIEHVLAWPGYLWLATMWYLLVISLVLEIPRMLAVRLARRGRGSAGRPASDGPDRMSVATSGSSAAPPVPGLTDAVTSPAIRARPTGRPAVLRARLCTVSPTVSTAMSTDPATDPATVPATASATASATALGVASATEESAPGTTGEVSPTGQDGRLPEPLAQLDRRMFISRATALITGVGALATVGYGTRTALGDPVIERVPVRLARLDPRMNGLRIAVVSDIHLGPLTGLGHTERIVRMINGLRADLVAIVGDLVDGTVAELGRLAAPLRSVESRYGAYFVTGNHEYFLGEASQDWIEELGSLGVRTLRNERIEIRHAGAVLDLAGVNDVTGQLAGDGPDLAKALAGRDEERPVVLLAHQPILVGEAAAQGVDLQLSGHTHGGQMAPFNLFVPLQQPVVAGLAAFPGSADGTRDHDTQVYVTRGAGFWGPPVRVGAPPEISLIELHS